MQAWKQCEKTFVLKSLLLRETSQKRDHSLLFINIYIKRDQFETLIYYLSISG